MSGNKVNNKLDFRNIKNTQLDGSQVEKAEFSDLQSAKRIFTTTPILKDAFTHFLQTTNANGYPTYVEYWQSTSPAKDRLQMNSDIAGSKTGTYFALQEYLTKRTHVFWYRVSGLGSAPGIGDIETPIDINTNDSASVVAYASNAAINSIEEFSSSHPTVLSSYVEIEYFQFGDTALVDVGTSGFISTRVVQGTSFKVGDIALDYDVNGDPIYGGNTLKGLLFNPYTASFDIERSDITVTATVDLAPLISKDPIIYNIPMPVAGIEYSITLPLSTKRFEMNVRDHLGKYTVGWVSAGAIITKSVGASYTEEGLAITAGNDVLYFTGTQNSIVMEIVTWS